MAAFDTLPCRVERAPGPIRPINRIPRPASARELQAALRAEREGVPFLLYRDGSGTQVLLPLRETDQRVSIGRRKTNAVAIEWDGEISRTHAELETVGGDWAIRDDGLSRNGTFVNGSRIDGRRRLSDGDEIRVGNTLVAYRAPQRVAGATTFPGAAQTNVGPLTATQRQVLCALCRPYGRGSSTTPATNQAIAAELHLSLDAVKNHLRLLFQKFQLSELPQNEKRARLAEEALLLGVSQEQCP